MTPVGPYPLPALRYDYAALEPWIDERTLREHHAIHHRQAVDALNAALARRPEWLGLTIERLMSEVARTPEDIRADVLHHGGSHANHQFLWKVLSPAPNAAPHGEVARAIENCFGGFARFQRQFETAAGALNGPGWAFLVSNPAAGGQLEVMALPDNGSVLPLGRMGLLVCDLWPHAYEARYGTDLARWLDAWWQLADWTVVEQRYQQFGRRVPNF